MIHAPDRPAEGPLGLLVVLPGGDGSADFAGFVGGRVAAEAGAGYVVVQLIAPPIEDGDRRAVVWPTERVPDDRTALTTEAVADAAVAAAMEAFEIDRERVFSLGWSSGGPAAYTLAMREETEFDGAFVAMSVFKPELLPREAMDAGGLGGRSFFVLHSPDDFISMSFPRAAERQLSGGGARVRRESYDGGHGWRAGALALLPEGLRWLDEGAGADQAE